jgi:hypothetical protein
MKDVYIIQLSVVHFDQARHTYGIIEHRIPTDLHHRHSHLDQRYHHSISGSLFSLGRLGGQRLLDVRSDSLAIKHQLRTMIIISSNKGDSLTYVQAL